MKRREFMALLLGGAAVASTGGAAGKAVGRGKPESRTPAFLRSDVT
jgi:hypothetical protein